MSHTDCCQESLSHGLLRGLNEVIDGKHLAQLSAHRVSAQWNTSVVVLIIIIIYISSSYPFLTMMIQKCGDFEDGEESLEFRVPHSDISEMGKPRPEIESHLY